MPNDNKRPDLRFVINDSKIFYVELKRWTAVFEDINAAGKQQSMKFYEDNFKRVLTRTKTEVILDELLESPTDKATAPTLEIAPGFKLHSFLTSICPKAFSERELNALHADAIELYYEKLQAGDKWGAMRVRWSMRGWMLWTVFGGFISGLFAMVRGKHKSSE